METIHKEIKDERNVSSTHEKEIDSLMIKIKEIQNAGLDTTTVAASKNGALNLIDWLDYISIYFFKWRVC